MTSTNSLPPASPGQPYAPVALAVTGSQGGATWSISSGTLPSGMALTTAGVLSGTPAIEGFFAFTVRASDAVSADTQTLGLSVATFGMVVTGGLF